MQNTEKTPLSVIGSPLLEKAAKNGKPLYAVAFNIRVGRFWRPHPVEYVHAEDAPTAKSMVIQGFPNHQIDIIAVAPAIGFFVEDNHGEKLIA